MILLHRSAIRARLAQLHADGRIDAVPTLWQVWLGVLYMRYRMVFRSDTIGVDTEATVRDTRRARFFDWRPLRAPALIWEGGVHPVEVTGLATTDEELEHHLITAYHPRDNALYDLALLSPSRLPAFRERVAAIVDGTDAKAEWFQDLVVYGGYHARLLAMVDRALADDFTPDPGVIPSDASLRGYIAWCCEQPATPAETLAAMRQGTFTLAPA